MVNDGATQAPQWIKFLKQSSDCYEALLTYIMVCNYLPEEAVTEALKDFNMPSSGTGVNLGAGPKIQGGKKGSTPAAHTGI